MLILAPAANAISAGVYNVSEVGSGHTSSHSRSASPRTWVAIKTAHSSLTNVLALSRRSFDAARFDPYCTRRQERRSACANCPLSALRRLRRHNVAECFLILRLSIYSPRILIQLLLNSSPGSQSCRGFCVVSAHIHGRNVPEANRDTCRMRGDFGGLWWLTER